MKLGLGLYKDMLTHDNFQFAVQTGCTHIVAHLANYYAGGSIVPSTDGEHNYGISYADKVWSEENLTALKNMIQDEGLVLEAIENFSPIDWYDVLLDGPKRNEQMENLKQIIRNVGKAGIPVFGYNFSIAGVWGHERKRRARGEADTACFDHEDGGCGFPIPNGEVWNMTYDPNAPDGYIPCVTHEELWDRWSRFIDEILPVAEEAGVRMAAHPDDPPMPTIRGQARLVYEPRYYQKMLDVNPSPANCFEFCMGSIQEMSEGNIYELLERYSLENRLAYIHFRNVKGKVPHYVEAFVDDGDIDMIRCVKILNETNYNGILIPDHTPLIDCNSSWHAGMAFALGYMRAAMQAVHAG